MTVKILAQELNAQLHQIIVDAIQAVGSKDYDYIKLQVGARAALLKLAFTLDISLSTKAYLPKKLKTDPLGGVKVLDLFNRIPPKLQTAYDILNKEN